MTDDGSRAAAALAHDQREFARYLFAGRAADDLSGPAVEFDRTLARLDDADYATVRRSALLRWPVPTRIRRSTDAT